MTTLKKSEAEIRRLVPRLMDFNFGCLVRARNWENCIYICDGDDGDRYIKYQDDWSSNCSFPNSDVEIIGHPITLEDVLEALARVCNEYSICALGNGKCLLGGESWILGKPYSEQSPEVHNFVTNILFSK